VFHICSRSDSCASNLFILCLSDRKGIELVIKLSDVNWCDRKGIELVIKLSDVNWCCYEWTMEWNKLNWIWDSHVWLIVCS
jgi:hypothetical protein